MVFKGLTESLKFLQNIFFWPSLGLILVYRWDIQEGKCNEYTRTSGLTSWELLCLCVTSSFRWSCELFTLNIRFLLFRCGLGVAPLCMSVQHGSLHLCFCIQTPPEKQQRPKSLQLGDRRLTLSLFHGVSSQLSLSNPLSPLPASPHTPRTPRSSSKSSDKHAALHVITSFPLTKLHLTHGRGGESRLLTQIRSHTYIQWRSVLSPVAGYSSLLSDNDVNIVDTPGTPPPMPPKKHPHEIDNPGFPSEVRLLAGTSTPSLMHI